LLRGLDPRAPDNSLASGTAGLAVFFASLAEEFEDDQYAAAAHRFLAAAIDGAQNNRRMIGLGLHRGLSGVSWAESCVCPSHRAQRDDLDELLMELLARPWEGGWDLSTGLVGIGVYALARSPSNAGLLAAVLGRLAEAAEADGGWGGNGSTRIDLSLAQGLGSVVAFSALAVRSGMAPARPLLAEAAGRLLAYRLRTHEGDKPATAFLPDPHRGALAWCHGDLGVTASLVLAVPLLSHPELGQALSRAVEAVAAPGHRVQGLGLCHGAAGAAHVLGRLAVATGSRAAREAAGHWAGMLLEAAGSGASAGGHGILEGAAGVGLALLGAASERTPRWDRMLLLA
ncbi:MAG TPA: lanthionine synthetase LanC family protein, partial [Actinomycetota bacterium]|nr:lanthionine synthetase LanC family protein [Actinomycetota bacterium]